MVPISVGKATLVALTLGRSHQKIAVMWWKTEPGDTAGDSSSLLCPPLAPRRQRGAYKAEKEIYSF